ncbi:hypothetical protein ACYF6T_35185, partial [Streptomyces sp. 7R007]
MLVDRAFVAPEETGAPRWDVFRRPSDDAEDTAVLPAGAPGVPAPRDPWEPPAAPTPRDPWEPPAGEDHTHDPHEVTVQLDAVGLQQDLRLREARGAQEAS